MAGSAKTLTDHLQRYNLTFFCKENHDYLDDSKDMSLKVYREDIGMKIMVKINFIK